MVARISIRTGLLSAVAGLSFLAAGALGWHASVDWRALSNARQAQQADAAANRLTAGLSELLLERMATNTALQASEPADAEMLREIERRRAAVRDGLEPGLAALAELDFPGRDVLVRDLRAALGRADAVRRDVDAALRLSRDRRDEALRRDYVPTITATVNAALAVWFSASHALASADPVLTRLAVVKELGWRLRDNAGQERSGIAGAMSANEPLSAQRLRAHTGFRAGWGFSGPSSETSCRGRRRARTRRSATP